MAAQARGLRRNTKQPCTSGGLHQPGCRNKAGDNGFTEFCAMPYFKSSNTGHRPETEKVLHPKVSMANEEVQNHDVACVR